MTTPRIAISLSKRVRFSRSTNGFPKAETKSFDEASQRDPVQRRDVSANSDTRRRTSIFPQLEWSPASQTRQTSCDEDQ